jgi:hypothetical protein
MIPFPFTAAELFFALSLAAPEQEARQLAEAIVHQSVPQPGELTGWGLSLETLILLSLASPELNDRVEKFLRNYWPSLDLKEWSQKREEIRQGLALRKADEP